MTVWVVRVADNLPEGFDLLGREAAQEGIRNMTRLGDDWINGQRFALFAAFVDGKLAGVGGFRPETAEAAMRMTRFYVRAAFRQQGVGRALAVEAIQHAKLRSRRLVVNARASEAAIPFWEALNFRPITHRGYTHSLQLLESAP